MGRIKKNKGGIDMCRKSSRVDRFIFIILTAIALILGSFSIVGCGKDNDKDGGCSEYGESCNNNNDCCGNLLCNSAVSGKCG